MDIVNLIISLISGAVGGNLGGAAVSDKSLGTAANTLLGLVGGVGGDWLLRALGILAASGAANNGQFDLTSLLSTILASGVSGGVLTAVVGVIKSALDKR